MLFKYSTILVFGIFAALKVHASVLPRAHECFTIESGKLAALVGGPTVTGIDTVLDLDGSKNLIQPGAGVSGKVVKAEFQACPKLGFSPAGLEHLGRLKITGTDNCLAVTPATGPPWTVTVKKCTSNNNPSTSQTWGYGDNLGNNIFYAGSPSSAICPSGPGVLLTGVNPNLSAGNTIQLACSSSIEPLTLKH